MKTILTLTVFSNSNKSSFKRWQKDWDSGLKTYFLPPIGYIIHTYFGVNLDFFKVEEAHFYNELSMVILELRSSFIEGTLNATTDPATFGWREAVDLRDAYRKTTVQ